jgi:hypothetical protein
MTSGGNADPWSDRLSVGLRSADVLVGWTGGALAAVDAESQRTTCYARLYDRLKAVHSSS